MGAGVNKLSNAIGSPANQVRMLQQNMSNLTRVIGNLFLPVVQNVLPYVNGLAIAFQNLFTWVGGLLGIKLDAINSSIGGMSDEMADLVGRARGSDKAFCNGACIPEDFCIRALPQDKKRAAVSKLLGHAKVDMTVKYYLVDDLEDMQYQYSSVN